MGGRRVHRVQITAQLLLVMQSTVNPVNLFLLLFTMDTKKIDAKTKNCQDRKNFNFFSRRDRAKILTGLKGQLEPPIKKPTAVAFTPYSFLKLT